MRRRCALSVWGVAVGIGAWAWLSHSPAMAADAVVTAGPRTPVAEAAAFHLPPGFEAQLVAAEPDIHKPINISFDERGRLWVTDTIEYPFPAPDNRKTKARDTVKILEDFGPDGKARKITTFADDLNIPVGVLPLPSQTGRDTALVYSIPGIWRMTDTTGAGAADQRDLVVSGQAHDDTHGMTGSFTEGFDGYIYAVHGFRNTSAIKGTDGSVLEMNSGNTYRFKPDGSHLQQHTHGQVNPFGMCLDPLGNLYTSDCETMPILLTLRGAYYSSFGKPDDGLGFGPDIADHMYGSSAIAGLLDYVADQYPPAYHDMMLVGNVVTDRINRAQLVPRGSAVHADDAPDFLISDDAWFRPVCIKLGPDGALYIADFYNRIIGHYEVDLHHPGRDKERGRIWRIVYKGTDAKPAPTKPFDLTKASIPELIAYLSDANFTVRMLAMQHLADATGQAAIAPLKEALAQSPTPLLKVHGMWVLHRLGALDGAMLQAFATDADMAVRVHAMRVLSETASWTPVQRDLALRGLNDADPLVQRCAADAFGQHPALENVRPLLDAKQHAPAADKHLVHTIRMALRNQLDAPGMADKLPLPGWSEQDAGDLVDAAAGASSPGAVVMVLKQINAAPADGQKLANTFRHAARYGNDEQVQELAKLAIAKFAGDDSLQLALFKALQEGVAQRGGKLGGAARAWGRDMAGRLLANPGDASDGWANRPLAEHPNAKNPWSVQLRQSSDGNTGAPFLSSLPRGEQGTGVLRSKDFAIPETLSFYIAGHNGQPSAQLPVKNFVRLRATGTDEVLAESPAPRNDMAQKVTWKLTQFAGRKGYFEATDGDTATAYAWIAFGRFEPPVVRVPAVGETNRLQTAIDIAASLQLSELEASVAKVLATKGADLDARIAAAKALPSLAASGGHTQELVGVLSDGSAPEALREAVAAALAQDPSPAVTGAFVEALRTAPNKLQLSLAKSLAASTAGAEALLGAVGDGKASARLLQDANLRERLGVSKPADLNNRIAKLTANLPAPDRAIQQLIDQRAAHFDRGKASPERGLKVFTANCAVCHSIGGVGAHVGPQLDGMGVRGPARLCEDILDPSRNVDAAFRYSTYVLDSGDVVAGILRREEGDTLVIADATGKEVTLQKSKIKRAVQSNLSLMPSNFGEIIKAEDFDDLVGYLLTK
ncbi:MAG: Cytochrome c [Phycisphaerales bacterium]|nr:Cytochrome c [Phycisphaerales bacterium]